MASLELENLLEDTFTRTWIVKVKEENNKAGGQQVCMFCFPNRPWKFTCESCGASLCPDHLQVITNILPGDEVVVAFLCAICGSRQGLPTVLAITPEGLQTRLYRAFTMAERGKYRLLTSIQGYWILDDQNHGQFYDGLVKAKMALEAMPSEA